jgi:hypothetical protein
MKKFLFSVFLSIVLFACKQPQNKVKPFADIPDTTTIDNYFPVTNYILGEIEHIKSLSLNPLMIVSSNNKTDSTWLQLQDLEKVMQPFLTPVIDTANMKALYRESQFEDPTLNNYTWSYEPYKILPDSFTLKRWDVYVNPQQNRVSRVYWVKNITPDLQQQLTWNSGKSCKILEIRDNKGDFKIERETIIKWDFKE